MLVGIHPCVSPELFYALVRLGHGDEIAVVDAYYPGHSNNDLVIRCCAWTTTSPRRWR